MKQRQHLWLAFWLWVVVLMLGELASAQSLTVWPSTGSKTRTVTP
jgi:hypothetical protein